MMKRALSPSGGRCALPLIVLLLLLSTTCRCHQVSFYGDSFLRMTVNHAGAANEVELKFYTSRPDGLLLLAAGTTDFCRIEIRAGMIQARMELGGGPAFVSSPPGVVFSDLRWHHVHLRHSRSSLKMTVDGIYASEVSFPGKFIELNLDNSVYVGGGLTFDDKVFFGSVFDFRGCISDATFNSLDLFQVAKDRGHSPSSEDDSVVVSGLTWTCSPEFGALSSLPIRFVDSAESFVAFRSLGTRQEATVQFSVKTRSSQAMLLFSSGGSSRSDYIALRLIAGQLVLHINKGSGTFSMLSIVKVNDGSWHQVELYIDRATARLNVDGQRTQNETLFTDNRFLDLTTHLFVGGVDARTRQEILDRSIPTRAISPFRVTSSLFGCIEGLRVDGNALGFQEAVRSRSLLPDCQRQFPCQSNPCPPDTNCIEADLDSFVCFARESLTTSVERFSSYPIGEIFEDVVRISPLVVREGDRSPITPQIIRLIANHSLAKVQDNDIWFRIVNPPTHGEVIVQSDHRLGNKPDGFNMKGLKDAAVLYEHDGSETTADSLRIEMEISGGGVSDDTSSSVRVFGSKHEFTVPIRVLPVNDRPEIELPENENLILVVNTQVKVTPVILNAVDADDKPSSLEYTVYQQPGADVGYFEILNSNGVRARISKFTQEDINKGRVDYIHRGVHNQRIRIQVSDGRDSSDLKVLKVVAVPLLLHQVVNGGSVVPKSGSIPITRNNLTFSTNAPNQDIEIRYVVTDPPYEGEIQRQQYTDNEWVVVSTFTQKNIDKNRIRYSHYNDSDVRGDYFRFRVSAMDIETQEFEYHLSVIDTRVEIVRNRPLVLSGTRERPVTWDELKSVSTLPYHGPQDITYRLNTNPVHGYLYRTYPGIGDDGKSRKKRLGVGSNLTQADINEGRIVYRLTKALHSIVSDGFEFQVSASGASPVAQKFQVTYEPIVGKLRITNNGLTDVGEGESAVITADDLFIEMNGFRDFRYVVSDFPRHGVLRLVEQKTKVILVSNASIFSRDDIANNRVQYLHDDSETEEDSFSFTVTSVADQEKQGAPPQEIVEHSGSFEITVLLKNDNPPQRIVDKVFYVVTGRGRSMTPDDLFYDDADVNFDSLSLEYTWQTISNGLIVLAFNHSVPLFRFTQSDIVDGIVYLQHKDAAYGKSVIWVSDGKHISTNLLEIQASDPFVRLESNVVVVERGQSIAITKQHLKVITNVDVAKRNVTFHVTQAPIDGTLTVGGLSINRFSQVELEAEQVLYNHGGKEDSSHDAVRLQVSAVTCHTEGVLKIRVMSAKVPERSLKVISNTGATIEEMESFTFTGYHLNVSGSNRHPSQIRFSFAYPRYGRLSMKARDTAPETFTQHDINSELITYEHLDAMGFEDDEIVFNVTDGWESLTNLRFHVKVIPSMIPLEVSDIVVKEGDRVYLSKDRIMIPNRYYESEDVELVLVKGPLHGRIEYQANRGQRRTHFSYAQVRAWAVVYAHDGSEALQDRFSLVARLRGNPSAQSHPRSIQVTVLPSNDQLPRISVNRPLHVWMGSRTVLTRDHLSIEDSDSSAEEIQFIVRTVTHDGHLALVDQPLASILNFTQRQIDDELIVFVHKGSSGGNVIDFDVTDGLNVLKGNNFSIVAQQLTIALENKATSIEAFPGILQPITSIHLNATTHDLDYPWPINYSLVVAPSKGHLLGLANSLTELREVNSFTQKEIDNLTVFYNFSTAMSKWVEVDEFVLRVTSDYATTDDNQTVSVRVAFDNINADNRHDLISTESAVVVQEGGQIQLSKNHLDTTKLKRALTDSGMKNVEVYYVLVETPRHGVLEVRGRNATRDDRFTQRDINKGYVAYIHDHSESFQDVFSYLLKVDLVAGFEDGARKSQLEPKFRGFVNITILSVNDQIFHLVTSNPSIELVQGFRFNITRRELLTVDADTGPEDIRYEVTIPPRNGLIVQSDDPTKSIASFTQEDIDGNRVQFIQDGSTRSGVFFFHVTDGGFLPLNKAFNIYVHPLRLQLGNSSEVVVIQGDITVVLNATHIPLITNGVRGLVRYNVTRFPSHGRLYLGDLPMTTFTQWDVDRADVLFIQNDIRHSADSFDLVAYDSHNVLPPRRFNVVVRTRVRKEEPFKTGVGDANRMTLHHLDASELALTTGSNPTYYVLSQPVFGQFILHSDLSVRRRRESRTAETADRPSAETHRFKRKNRNRISGGGGGGLSREPGFMRNAVFVFTHDDVVNERVEYRPLPYTISTRKTDSVSYVLHARNAQPATDTLRIIVNPPSSIPFDDEDRITAVTAPVAAPAFTNTILPTGIYPAGETDTSLAAASSDEKSQFHLVVVLLVSGLTIVIIVIVIATRCYALQKRRRRYRIAAAVAQDAAMFKDLPLSLGNGCYPVAPDDPQQSSDLPDDDPSGVFVFPTRRSRPRDSSVGEGKAKMGVAFAEPVGSDWDNVDPEIVQHCRKSNPLLHKEKVWV